MGAPWHRAEPDRYEQLQQEVRREYPELFFTEEGDTVFLRGTYPLEHAGRIWARYVIEVEFPHNFPDVPPVVRETGGRIPREPDWHIDDDAGGCCLYVIEEFLVKHPDGYTILEFLEGPVRSFFVNTYHKELTGEPLFGERSHGAEGIREFYEEYLETDDPDEIRRYIDTLRKDQAKGHLPCPCGSGQNLRDCHEERIREIRGDIPPDVAERTWQVLYQDADPAQTTSYASGR